MASLAVLLIFGVERLLSVMTLAAGLVFGDFGHVRLIRSVGHLKYPEVAPAAFKASPDDVLFMAEYDRPRIFRRERQVPAAHLLREGADRRQEAKYGDRNRDYFFHLSDSPLSRSMRV